MRLQSILKNWKISKFLTNKGYFFSRKKYLNICQNLLLTKLIIQYQNGIDTIKPSNKIK